MSYGSAEPRLERIPSGPEEHEHAAAKVKSRLSRFFDWLWWFITDQWFLIALGLLILISSQVQVPGQHQETKKTVVTYLGVAIIFFITGCTLSTELLMKGFSQWKLHLFVQCQCFLLASSTAYAVVSACATDERFMDPWLLIGLIFMGCVPTTISSNVVMTTQAGGSTALTVVESTLGNFLGPFLTPLLVTMYTSTGAWYIDVLPTDSGSYGEIYKRVFRQLGLSLFLPVFVGQVVQNLFPNATNKVFKQWSLSKLSSIALLAVIWQAYDSAFASGAFESVKANNIIFICFMSVAFYGIWLAICVTASVWWLSKEDTISVAYCVPAKTPAMGVPLSMTMYVGLSTMNESKLQIPMVIFQGFQVRSEIFHTPTEQVY